MLLAVMTGLLVIMLVAVFSTAAKNAYARKQDASHTLKDVRRTGEALLLKEKVRIELGWVETALHESGPGDAHMIARILALHDRSERGLMHLEQQPRSTQKLRARLAELRKRRADYNRMFNQALVSLRAPGSRRAQDLPAAWRDAVLSMLDAVDTQSLDQSDVISNADSFINEMMRISDLAWSMRAIAGTDRRAVANAILQKRRLSRTEREGFIDAGGRTGALWTQFEAANREHPFPPRLRSAFENAQQVYVRAYQDLRSNVISRMTRGEHVSLSGEEWLNLSNPGLDSIIAISKHALSLTEGHAVLLAAQADRNFTVAVMLMLMSIILACSAMLYVMWRVIVPLKTITRTMRAIAGGDLTRKIPFGHRHDEIGQFSQALRMFRDSAVIQQGLETELLRNRSARDAAETSNRLKSEFLANMSHELRTPLNAILGFSEMIGMEVLGPGRPQYRGYANDIHFAGSHLLSLINEVLDLSKAEAGKLELRCEQVDVAELIEECMRLVRGRAGEQDLNIRANVRRLPPLFADRLRVKQILLNLLSNAIKFTPEGGEVALDADWDGGQMIIEVRDTGIGIAPEMIPLAFEPFRQVDSVLARRFEGTGLGLSLVKSFMALHGGDVTIRSALGKGTTVSVSFPQARCMDAAAARPAFAV
jgi:signal transduction histidine kinase